MKYFKVRNDIIKTDAKGNATTTDEPLWIRTEIDSWKERYGENIGGGRFFADEDARYSYIISPNDNLMDLSNNDLEEISEVGIITIINKAFPPSVITREGEPDEIIPSPSLKKVCSIFWGYATNHTGTISADETWTLANNDHHITGNITLAADKTLTIDPGVNVYYDGSYTITTTAGSGGTTRIIAIGTSANRITIEANASRTNTASYNTMGTMIQMANNTSIILQYCNIANGANPLAVTGCSNCTLTLDHLEVRDISSFVTNTSNTTIVPVTITNSRFIRCLAAIIGFGNAITGTGGNHYLTNCMISGCQQVITGTVTSGSNTVNYTDCLFIDRTIMSPASGNTIVAMTHVFTRCFVDCSMIWMGAAETILSNCILTRSTQPAGVYYNISTSTKNQSATNCDFIHGNMISTGYAVQNATTAATTMTLTSCYIAGWRGADYLNYYTGSETPAQTVASISGAINHVTPRTTRNFPFTQSSISISGVGDNTATVSWTGAFRARNRVRYGTVSGTYDMSVEPVGGWSNFDGKGQWQTSPTIVLNNLKTATTYYYICETYDPVLNSWNTSVENTFSTTTPAVPTFSGITGLENVGFGALLVSWGTSTGTTTNYNIYAKIGSAPTFSEKPIKVDTSYTSFKLTHLSDGTRLTDSDNVYVSVRAENTPTLIDTNIAVLNEYVQGSGSVGVIVGDTVAISLKG